MLDIIIPCHNTAQTLPRAVQSCLNQPEAERIWLIDDASTDNTWQTILQLQQQFPNKIQAFRLPENGGAAMARNWGALQSSAPLIAFLDADDEYQQGALAAACFAFAKFDFLGLIRLRLHAVGMPERYRQHPNFARAWHSVQMTVGGNTVFRRVFSWRAAAFRMMICSAGLAAKMARWAWQRWAAAWWARCLTSASLRFCIIGAMIFTPRICWMRFCLTKTRAMWQRMICSAPTKLPSTSSNN